MSQNEHQQNLGFIGTGLMGFPMAQRLLESGFRLNVYNRTRSKAIPLQKYGAEIAEHPRSIFQSSHAVILMLTDAAAIDQVLKHVSLRSANPAQTLIQMGTILPEESLRLASRAKSAGWNYLEAPVLGSIPEATSGKLIIMAGGSERVFSEWESLLQALGKPVYYIGSTGKAAAVKLALNQLIVSLTAAFSLSLGIVRQWEVDEALFMQILQSSALYAPTFQKKMPRYLSRNFETPNFPVKHMLKDVKLIDAEADYLGLDTTLVSAMKEILEKTIEAGFADSDYSAIYNVISPKITHK